MDVPYVNCEMWMTSRTYENYADGYGKLPEDQEGEGNVGNLPR